MKKSELKKIVIDEINNILSEQTTDVSSTEMDVLKLNINNKLDVEGTVGVNSLGVIQYYIDEKKQNALYIASKGGYYHVFIGDIVMEKKLTKPAKFGTFQSAMSFAVRLANKAKPILSR